MKTQNERVKVALVTVLTEQLENCGELINLCSVIFNRYPPENMDPGLDPEPVKWVSDVLALTALYREKLNTIKENLLADGS